MEAATLKNLLIGKHTRVIFQGFTGRVATQNAKDSLQYGTNIVGGVTPGKDAEHLGLPVCPSVRAAKERLNPDATAIFVPMTGAAAAIQEAIEAEIPLIVAVAEHIPVYDMLRIKGMLRTSKSRLVGANSPGIIAPLGSCRIGFQPLPIYKPGNIGVVAKSGTLSYETVGSLSRADLGQSLCVGCGGDPIAGTTLEDAFSVLIEDPNTHGMVIAGEIGGDSELRLAARIQDYLASTKVPKPIAALVAGRKAPHDSVMGHAGAFMSPADPTAEEKYQALENSGATMVDHPEKFGPVMQRLMSKSAWGSRSKSSNNSPSQRRSFHTLRRRPLVAPSRHRDQVRHLYLAGDKAVEALKDSFPGFEIAGGAPGPSPEITLYGTIDRGTAQIEATVKVGEDGGKPAETHSLFFPYSTGYKEPTKASAEALTAYTTSLKGTQLESVSQHLAPALHSIASFMLLHEALSITLHLSPSSSSSNPILHTPLLHLDDAAFKSANRQKSLFALRPSPSATTSAAEEAGIVYVTLDPTDRTARIGTIVNGAGLAMNTVDALALRNAKCANFLDTGGKATADTVKRSFALVLSDPRVQVVFVNIFGGLTDCGMIADGIILAFKELDTRGVPVVVRLRGTNEEEGQRRIAESGLPLEAFDGFDEAARRVVELAGR